VSIRAGAKSLFGDRWKRDLFWMLVVKEITIKYRRSVLGVFWSVVNPVFTAAVLVVAFTVFMRFDKPDYALFLLSALFAWNWFTTSVQMSTVLLFHNKALISKVVFPRQYLVVATITGQLVNLLASLPILVGLALYYGRSPSVEWIVGVPLLIAVQFLSILGVSLLTSITHAFLHDVEYVVGVLLNALFWMTPILYPLDAVPESYQRWLVLNPLLYLVSAWRDLFYANTLNWEYIGYSIAVGLGFLAVGWVTFSRLEKRLDEVL
jgi:lipopolysaccharide transport system permease protein